jgi:hypothetical protein
VRPNISEKIIKIEKTEVYNLTKDARLVGIRWDIVPWGLVLDLDAPVSEKERSPVRRAWLVFHGLSELNFPLINTRLPNGCWLNSSLSCSPLPNDFTDFVFIAIVPHFVGNIVDGKPTKEVVIRAKQVTGIVSASKSAPNDDGLTWEERNRLATDAEMRSGLEFE